MCITTDTENELDMAIEQAIGKGWREVDLMKGTDPETGKPRVVMEKGLEIEVKKGLVS
jgi:hypothetical protein